MKTVQQSEQRSLWVSTFPLIFSVVFITLLLVVSLIFKIQNYPFLIKEGGVVETLSACGYFLCAVVILLVGKWSYVKRYYYFFLLIITFGLRELDFDKKFTTMGILKSKFYVSDLVPLGEKLAGLFVIAVLLCTFVAIIRNHAKGFFSNLMKVSPVHIGVLLTFLLLIFTKTIDGISRKLGDLGFALEKSSSVTFEVIEELLELGIPILILSTLIVYFATKKLDKV